MAYVHGFEREILDPAINKLHRAIMDLELDNDENNTQQTMNYAITRLIRMVYGTDGPYQNINDVVGLLESIKLEHYRTCAAPLLDQQKFETGDVDSDKEPIVLNVVTLEAPKDDS